MINPYRLETPFVIHFSGGRTSGYLLHHILEAFDFSLPLESYVIFTNTGKEFNQTLDFIHEIETRWPIKIHWLEWLNKWPGYTEVNYTSASRDGEPFDALIKHKSFMPNPFTRMCTHYLKIETCHSFLVDWWGPSTFYDGAVGIRYDEPKRWKVAGLDQRHTNRTVVLPLVDAKVTQEQVISWWSKQSFNLQLKPHESNCDLCFLKSQGKRIQIMRDHPGTEGWWIAHEDWLKERGEAGGFRSANSPNYTKLYNISTKTDHPGFDDGDFQIECNCTD